MSCLCILFECCIRVAEFLELGLGFLEGSLICRKLLFKCIALGCQGLDLLGSWG